MSLIVKYKAGVLPERWTGRASWVFDGDTLRVLRDGVPWLVRVYGIDAPEFGQAFFREAAGRLRALVRGAALDVRPRCFDRYGRVVADVHARPGGDVAILMVREGLAWWDRLYGGDRRELKALEMVARDARRGLWSVRTGRWAPWVWRSRERVGR